MEGGGGVPFVMGYSVPPGSTGRYENYGRGGGRGGSGRRVVYGGGAGGTGGAAGAAGAAGAGGTGGNRKFGLDKANNQHGKDSLNLEEAFSSGETAVSKRILELEVAAIESRKKAETEWQGEDLKVDDKLISGDALDQLSLYVFEKVSDAGDQLASNLLRLLSVCVFGSKGLLLVYLTCGMRMIERSGRTEEASMAVHRVLKMLKRLAKESNISKYDSGIGESEQDYRKALVFVQALVSQLRDIQDMLKEISMMRTQVLEADVVISFQGDVFAAISSEVEELGAQVKGRLDESWKSCIRCFDEHLINLGKPLWKLRTKQEDTTVDGSKQHIEVLNTARTSSQRINESMEAFLSLVKFSIACDVEPEGLKTVLSSIKEGPGGIGQLDSQATEESIGGGDHKASVRKNTTRRLRFEHPTGMSQGTSQRRHYRMKSSPDELLHLPSNLDDDDEVDVDVEGEDAGGNEDISPVKRQLTEELDKVALEDHSNGTESARSSVDKESAPNIAKREVRRDHIRSRSVEDIIPV
ncbi:hypothetical protein NDN08_005973 [Rhodosorus marinus]|uniref:Uncharacterized protein n=1 Tax=Rhodosorus marinus TaxID=101924 RepID=A0AAV8UM90_9RHOD|nr:hypothetical protein NDN08_005973 [Rhodosorus marinus]